MSSLSRMLCGKAALSVLKNADSRCLSLNCKISLFLNEAKPCSALLQARGLSTKTDVENTLIYDGGMTSRVRRIKFFSFTTSLMGFAAQPIMYNHADSLPLLIVASSFIGFFTFVTPVLLHLVTKRYVINITHNPEADNYTANLMSFFGRGKPVTFKPGEGSIPDIPGMFTTMEVKGIPMFIDVDRLDIEHFKRILGYDKPLDIRHSESLTAKLMEENAKKARESG